MTIDATVRGLNIAIKARKGKDAMAAVRRILPLILAVWGAKAAAVPVTIAWDVPLERSDTYSLEVAKDPGFADVVVKTTVKGTGFTWNTPAEGVYHWRLTRAGQAGAPAGQTAEASTFVSGSFVAIDGKAERAHPARLAWDPMEGADRYKLYVLDESAKTRTIIVQTSSFIIPKFDSSLMIEVVPYSGDRRTFRNYHFNPSLKLDTGVAAAPPPPPAVTQPVAPPPPPKAALAATAPSAEGKKPDAVPPPVAKPLPDEPASRRVHLVYAFGVYERERLRAQKLDLDVDSTKKSGGEGAGLWINPVAGLIVSGQGAYHEHLNRTKQVALFGDEELKVYEARYTMDLTVAYNLLDFWGVRSQVLSLGFAAASAQLPFLPVEYTATPGDPPKFDKKQLPFAGGGASYGYLGTRFAAVLEGGLLVDKADDAQLGYQRLLLDFYPLSHLSIELGAFNRFTQARRCASKADVCLREGKVTTTSQERGGILGLGLAFF